MPVRHKRSRNAGIRRTPRHVLDSLEPRTLMSAGYLFDDPMTVPVYGSPNSVEVADLNGDGLEDAVVGSTGVSRSVTVLLNQGETFLRPRGYEIGSGVTDLELGDVNEDGHTDIVAVAGSDRAVWVLFNDGNGVFTNRFEALSLNSGGSFKSLDIGDVNDDGHIDAVVTQPGDSSAYVFLGDGEGNFTESGSHGTGNDVRDVLLADLDGDDDLDIATADFADDTVSMLPNNGNGVFANRTSETIEDVGDGPTALAHGDLTGDGLPELVTANYYDGSVTVLRNAADAGLIDFSGRDDFELLAGNITTDVALGDMDNDGNLDIVAGSDTYVTILRGAGDANFRTRERYDLPSAALALTTVNNDHNLDIVAVRSLTQDVVVALNLGSGALTGLNAKAPVWSPARALVVGDLNNDGREDAIVGSEASSRSVSILLNAGDAYLRSREYTIGNGVTDLKLGDVNEDGHTDILAVAGSDRAIWVLFNDGNGVFTNRFEALSLNSGGSFSSLDVGDVNDDGHLDAVVTQPGDRYVFVYLGDGAGAFTQSGQHEVGNDARDVILADLDGDSDLDIATADHNDNTVSMLPNNGNGVFANRTSETIEDVGSGPVALAYGDLTGDGLPELVTANEYDYSVTVLRNVSDSGLIDFSGRDDFDVRTPSTVYDVALADLDADGNLDILAGASSHLSILRGAGDANFRTREDYDIASRRVALSNVNTDAHTDVLALNDADVTVALNDGLGHLSGGDPTLHTFGSPESIVVGDLNNDGLEDIAVGTSNGQRAVAILLNTGESFRRSREYEIGNGVTDLKLGDVNEDGHLDILAVAGSNRAVWVLFNDGNGVFTNRFEALSLNSGGSFDSLDVGDVNDDGHLDAVVTQPGDRFVFVYLGDGTGTFTQSGQHEVGNSAYDVILADLDGDGDLDIATADADDDTVSMLPNNGNGVFANRTSETIEDVGDAPIALAYGDLTGDGLPELVTANYSDRSATVLRNASDNGLIDFSGRDDFELLSDTFPSDVALGDLDGDGHMDIAVGSDRELTVFRGVGDGNFRTRERYDLPTYRLALGDLNDDGDLDAVGTENLSQGRVHTYINRSDSVGFRNASEIDLDDRTGDAGAINRVRYAGGGWLYRFVAPDTGPVSVQIVTSVSISLDARLRIFDADEREIASDDQGLPGATANLTFQGTAGATYYALVEGSNDQLGDFELEIDAEPETHFLYYPEGFSGSTINEFIPMVNPNDFDVSYTIYARYEVGERDQIIAQGTIAAHSRGGHAVSTAEDGSPVGIRLGTPYALEIRSDGQLGATLSHYDFGASTGENFTNEISDVWTFANVRKDADSIRDFILVYNPNNGPVFIDYSVFYDDGTSESFRRRVDGLRRAGINVNDDGAISKEGAMAIRLDASSPIVAAQTTYHVNDSAGSAILGDTGGGSVTGIVPTITAGEGVEASVAIFNPGNATANITLRAEYANGSLTPTVFSVSVAPRTRVVVGGEQMGLRSGELAGLRYESDMPVSVTADQMQRGDADATLAGTNAARTAIVGDAFINPDSAGTTYVETLSIYNPASINANVTLSFIFNDGSTVRSSYTIGSRGFAFISVDQDNAILSREGLAFFSLRVDADIPVVSGFVHYDLFLNGGWGTLLAPIGLTSSLGNIA
jgi:hypothetical protein